MSRGPSSGCLYRPARWIRNSITLTAVVWSLIAGQVLSPVAADPTANRQSRCDPGAGGAAPKQDHQTVRASSRADEDPDVQAGFPVTAYQTGGTGGGLGTHV